MKKNLDPLLKATISIVIAFALLTIFITGFWDIISTSILPNSSWGLYNKDFFENMLVEMHGGIIDLLLVSVLLYWFDVRKTRKELIETKKSELENLKYYCGSDASFRFYGTFKQLLELGVHDYSIPEANLSNLEIKSLSLYKLNLVAVNFSNSNLCEVTLKECKLEATQFIDCKLKHCVFDGSNLKRAKFINAELAGMNFERCDIRHALFKDCNLRSAIFKGLDCNGVSFKGSDLRSANFKGAINVSREMILESSNHKSIVLPDGINL